MRVARRPYLLEIRLRSGNDLETIYRDEHDLTSVGCEGANGLLLGAQTGHPERIAGRAYLIDRSSLLCELSKYLYINGWPIAPPSTVFSFVARRQLRISAVEERSVADNFL